MCALSRLLSPLSSRSVNYRPVGNTAVHCACAVGARGGMLFAALESPADDGPPDAAESSGVRIMTSNLSVSGARAGAHRRTTRYTLETIEGNELVDVQALGTTQSPESGTDAILTLEKAASATGYTVQLFEAYLHSRRNMSHCDPFASNCSAPVEKIAVQDLAALGRCSFAGPGGATEQLCTGSYRVGTWSPLQVDNFKAMAIGPRISDGRRTLLLVNDDSNSTRGRGTHFVLLALNEEHPTILVALSAVDDGPLVVLVASLSIFVVAAMARMNFDRRLRIAEQESLATARSQLGYTPKVTTHKVMKFTNPEADDSPCSPDIEQVTD